MKPTLIIDRGRTVTLEELPPNSIALDGYVQGPALDNVRRSYSFDHHKGCIRLITTATCEQVRDAIILGLDPSRFTIYVNDVDTDAALAVWALRNPDRLREPAVARFITAAGLLDAHGGAYNCVEERPLIEWLGEPETLARREGRYESLTTPELHALLDEIGARFEQLLRGELPPEAALVRPVPPYEILMRGTGWVLVAAADPHVLYDLYQQGIERIVAYRPLSDGTRAYTIAKKSDFVDDFNVPEILAALNRVEEGWGGGSTIGGAPRRGDGSRSRLTPEQLFTIIESVVTQNSGRS